MAALLHLTLVVGAAAAMRTPPSSIRGREAAVTAGQHQRSRTMVSEKTAPPRPPLSMDEYEARAANKLGRDPRDAPPWITSNAGLINELAAQAAAPKAAFASSTSAVSPILTLEEYEAAINRATEANRIAAFKFYSQGCRACLTIKPFYEKMSESPMSDFVDFYEIDASAARVLCHYANIKPTPVVHVYTKGELHATLPVHSRTLFSDFDVCLRAMVLNNWS